MPLTPDIRLDLEDIYDGFDAMKRQARNLTKVWQKLEPVAKRDQHEHARLQEGPDARWKPIAKTTRGQRLRSRRKAAAKRGKRIPKRVTRKVLGKLPKAISIRFNRDTFLTISKVPWSAAHQEGATVGRGVQLPKREHVYFSAQMLDRVRDEIVKHVAGGF